ncbi:hypothetical protein [Sulfitobacter sp.]|jgi:hypothetical protein|uniref:hypothetical protein n=1 Tax=Sulfitobacter sp. TaxID=1903071 RepID=UPI003562EAA1|tara:strand:- start:1052 stop:1417 length:366 start_codon:yes stop_codon:yes gene_type:complete
MTLIAIFLIVFVGGPLMFRVQTMSAPSPMGSRMLVFFALACAVGAIWLRYGTMPDWGEEPLVTVAGIVLIWWGWITVLAFGTQALRRADPGRSMRRLTAVIGTAGTTIPWFGLALASYMIA